VLAELRGFDVLRHELGLHGISFETEQINTRDIGNVVEELHLPQQLVDLYLEASPTPNSSIPWLVEELQIFSIRQFSAAQEGYRWSSPQRTRLENWPTNWVVIAAVFGDPFIVDIGELGAPVYFARHGAGVWSARRVSPSLTDFIEVLTRFESVLIGEYDRDVWNDEGLRDDYLRASEETLREILPPGDLASFLNDLD
jgi:hypothetical protein